MAVRIAMAGDTMLGRGVAERLRRPGGRELFSAGVRKALAQADLVVLNLECCVSERGSPWPDPEKRFWFRAPPSAATDLAELGVNCVTLANNHALDYGARALLDTLDHLSRVGIRVVGAGTDVERARAARTFEVNGLRLAVLGVTDHPAEYAAGASAPGVAHADLPEGVPDWLTDQIRRLRAECDVVLVTPHWGPNMVPSPLSYVRKAAAELVEAGATVVAGHSAHVFHGVGGSVLFDLGDFVDDYATHPWLRNDRGLLFLITLDRAGLDRIDAVPIALDYCHTRLADPQEYEWIRDRFALACAALGTTVTDEGDYLSIRCRDGA
ncbi:CapA family protein [Streptoalloteichus hindustanus]|uniref:Poly-gamma-glutamate synthesis protein (Capsule biosynthesis protein) n=1 Tax=Streptoalloteichus hindustanus TaxID=2017 RepID=A0A1M4XHY8_STRHI|nr:CapA family protein [Streptoalloteichus hindustanus]SHE93119.1 poly-gamma-glutamate synthesis protein (capsule biosynthesis protein) [Streptoalloteichus hindustanus]